MFDFTGDNVFVIGTVGEAPNILLTNNDLRNVPTEFPVSNTDWKGNLMYWADQLWLATADGRHPVSLDRYTDHPVLHSGTATPENDKGNNLLVHSAVVHYLDSGG